MCVEMAALYFIWTGVRLFFYFSSSFSGVVLLLVHPLLEKVEQNLSTFLVKQSKWSKSKYSFKMIIEIIQKKYLYNL
jgi:hypothetical protein